MTSSSVVPERVEEEEPPGERVAALEDQLQRLVRLDRADDPRQHAEHAALRAARRELGGRRLREEAAVARPDARVEHGDLALEAEDRAVDDRDPAPHGRVVHEVARREVVGAVDDHVPAVGEDPVDVLGGEPLLERHDLHVGVERLERPLRGADLRLAEPVGRVHDLALQVRLVDDVGVDDAERADAGGCEVERRGRAEPAGADEQDARVEQALLPFLADLGDEQVAAVARALLRRERRAGSVTSKPFRFQSENPPARLTTFS